MLLNLYFSKNSQRFGCQHFKKVYVNIEPYFNAVYFASPQSITPSSKAYDPLNQSLQDATTVSMNCKCIETSVKLNVETFKEASASKTKTLYY
mgnify:CR=1 FL=1